MKIKIKAKLKNFKLRENLNYNRHFVSFLWQLGEGW